MNQGQPESTKKSGFGLTFEEKPSVTSSDDFIFESRFWLLEGFPYKPPISRISGFHRCAAHHGDFHTMEELKTQIFDLVGLEKVKESMRTRNKTSCDRIQVQENNKKSQRSLLLIEEIRRSPPVLHEFFIKHGMLH